MGRSGSRLLTGVVGLFGILVGTAGNATYITPSSQPTALFKEKAQLSRPGCAQQAFVRASLGSSHPASSKLHSLVMKREMVARHDAKPVNPNQGGCGNDSQSNLDGVSEVTIPASGVDTISGIDLAPIVPLAASTPIDVDVEVLNNAVVSAKDVHRLPVEVVPTSAAAVPLPGTLLLFLSGLAGLSFFRRTPRR